MTLETFFENFNLFADAPDAVAKMRELVLELAVRGRFLPSHPTDPSDPFPIPGHWRWIALNEAADCRAAAKVDSSSLNASDWVLDREDIDGGAGNVITRATFADRPGFCTTEIIPLRPRPFLAAGYLRIFLRSPHFLRYAATKNYGMKMPRLGTKDWESAEIPLATARHTASALLTAAIHELTHA